MLKNDSEADQIHLKSRMKSDENTRIIRDHRKVAPDTFNEEENGTKPEQIGSSEISTPDTPLDKTTELETADYVQDAVIKEVDQSIVMRDETSSKENDIKNNIVDIKEMQPESASSDPLLSELIMPVGDKLNVDSVRDCISDSHTIEHKRVVLPDSLESMWKMTLQDITELENEDVISPDVEEIPNPKLSFIKRITQRFKREKMVLEDYDLEKHGPLVDLSIPENFLYDEIEVYEVNEPFAYVRVVYNSNTHSYLYQTLEPKLSEGEKQLFAELKMRLGETLDVNLTQLEKSGAEKYLREKVIDILWDYQIKIDTISYTKIMYFLLTEFMGYGIIDSLMHDSNLEDISCDGPHSSLFVYHRKYDSIEADIKFNDEAKLDGFVTRLAQICGKHISIADPLLDATMPDGSRIQLTLGREVTTRGSSFTIRKFRESPLTPPDLIDFHTYSTSIAAYMWLAAENNKNLIFAGGTASGKTTSMNAIALFIPPETKIVSIEDTRELNLPHPNWIAGVTREAFTGGESGSIDMYDLLRAALRQRPEYLLVGEVRGEEAYVLFQAMSTGHTTFSTIHADSVQSVVHRLENPPINVPRIMLQALDIVIIQVQVRVGEERVRRAKSITEIVGVDATTGELLTNEVFTWNASKDEFFYSGRSYVLESVMQNRGWNDEHLQDELKRRQEILEWARMKNVKHYKDVAKIVVSYYREPGTLMEIVRKELYGN